MSSNIYILFHIPKTAGTSFREMIRPIFQKNFYPYYSGWGEQQTQPLVLTENVSRAKYFMGHLVYYGMHEVIGNPCQYIIFLREPVKRFESYYNHIRIFHKNKDQPVPNLKEWLNVYKGETQIHCIVRGSKFTCSSFEQAKHILHNCSFIGLQETFEEDVKQLFGSDTVANRNNITEDNANGCGLEKVTFSKDEQKQVEELLSEDIQLYDYAVQLRSNGCNKDFQMFLDYSPTNVKD